MPLYTHVTHSSVQMKEMEIITIPNDMLNTTLEKKENIQILYLLFSLSYPIDVNPGFTMIITVIIK